MSNKAAARCVVVWLWAFWCLVWLRLPELAVATGRLRILFPFFLSLVVSFVVPWFGFFFFLSRFCSAGSYVILLLSLIV